MGQHSKPQHHHHPVLAVATWARSILAHQHPQPVVAAAEPGAVEWLSGTEWCQRHAHAAKAHQAATLGHDGEAVQA